MGSNFSRERADFSLELSGNVMSSEAKHNSGSFSFYLPARSIDQRFFSRDCGSE